MIFIITALQAALFDYMVPHAIPGEYKHGTQDHICIYCKKMISLLACLGSNEKV